MVGLDDLRGLFQPMILWFCDSRGRAPALCPARGEALLQAGLKMNTFYVADFKM